MFLFSGACVNGKDAPLSQWIHFICQHSQGPNQETSANTGYRLRVGIWAALCGGAIPRVSVATYIKDTENAQPCQPSWETVWLGEAFRSATHTGNVPGNTGKKVTWTENGITPSGLEGCALSSEGCISETVGLFCFFSGPSKATCDHQIGARSGWT